MFSGLRLCSIAKRRENRFAFVPVRELIGVMTAARLAGLSCRNEQDGLVPVGRISDESHCRAVVLQGSSHNAVFSSRLRFARDAEKAFQRALVADGMQHVQRSEPAPGPVFDALALALFGESGNDTIGSRGEQFVIALIGGRKPLRRAVGQNSL